MNDSEINELMARHTISIIALLISWMAIVVSITTMVNTSHADRSIEILTDTQTLIKSGLWLGVYLCMSRMSAYNKLNELEKIEVRKYVEAEK
jgi:hypothetical protein